MPEKILGLDIGHSYVKAVLLSRGFRREYRVLGARCIDLAAAGGLAEAIKQLFAEPGFRGSVCVTALHPADLSFRSIRLPFRDERRIRQTLAFALEPLVQQPLDGLFIDYTLAGPAGHPEIFAALAPRTLVGERLALLQEYVRETAVIDIGAVSLTLRLSAGKGQAENVLLLDVGARDTTAVFAGRGRILHIRKFPFGAQPPSAMTEALASSPEPCGRFLDDLKNTWSHLQWRGSLVQPPGRILLTGGGARTPGLAEGLTACFSVPVELADLAAEAGIQIDAAIRKSWDPVLMDQALALAARPLVKGSGFNFRQRVSEARAGYGELRDRLRKGAVAASVILALAGIEIGLDDYGARLRLAALKQEIQSEFKRIAPEVTRIVDPVAQLRGKIADAKKSSASAGNGAAALTVLDILREISALAPAGLTLTTFNLDGEAISLKGEAPNFDVVDTIKKAFANSKIFKTVTIGSTNMMKQGGALEFDMKMTLKK
jgi:general secretion pathway protein L